MSIPTLSVVGMKVVENHIAQSPKEFKKVRTRERLTACLRFSSPEQRSRRAIVLTPGSALASAAALAAASASTNVEVLL